MREIVLVVVFVLVGASCDWPQYLDGPERSGSSPDTSISAAAISGGQVVLRWNAGGGGDTAPVAAGGLVYHGGAGGGVDVFDSRGRSNCTGSPAVCSPLWTAVAQGTVLSHPAVANGVLVALGLNGSNGRVAAFDAAGVMHCSGVPKVCAPLWTATTVDTASSVTVAQGVVYQSSKFPSFPPSVGVAAYDLAGSRNCGGSPVVCTPLWSATVPGDTSVPPSVANGVAYLAASTGLFAFDAGGRTNCQFTPVVCEPLWVAGVPGGVASGAYPVVANGLVFVAGASPKNLYGFDAAGVRGCDATLGVCGPVWNAAQAGPNPSVAGGKVYVNTADSIAVFDASGSTNCQGTTVKTCSALWSYNTGSPDCYWATGACGELSPPVLANGVLYQGYFNKGTNGLNAYDATATIGCSGVPKRCGPIRFWSGGSNGAPAISNGFIYTRAAFSGPLNAFGLPSA